MQESDIYIHQIGLLWDEKSDKIYRVCDYCHKHHVLKAFKATKDTFIQACCSDCYHKTEFPMEKSCYCRDEGCYYKFFPVKPEIIRMKDQTTYVKNVTTFGNCGLPEDLDSYNSFTDYSVRDGTFTMKRYGAPPIERLCSFLDNSFVIESTITKLEIIQFVIIRKTSYVADDSFCDIKRYSFFMQNYSAFDGKDVFLLILVYGVTEKSILVIFIPKENFHVLFNNL